MKISACLIVKDDSELVGLKKAVKSIIDHVDGVYITANGKKVKKIEEWCKGNDKIHYSYFKWIKDFSAARNFNFGQVPKDSDFIFWLDADDVVLHANYLPEIANIAKKTGKDAVFFTYFYGCRFSGKLSEKTLKDVELIQMRERLLKPGVIMWKGRLHETPIPLEGAKYKYTTYSHDKKKRPFVVLHLGADRKINQKKLISKMERNQELLELQLEDEKSQTGQYDPRTLLYLMKIYAESDDEKVLDKCLIFGDEYLTKSGWDEERSTCYYLMAKVYGKLNNDKKAVSLLHKAINEYPTDPLNYLRLSRAYFNLKKYKHADHWLKIALSMNIDDTASSMTNVLEMKILSWELMLKMSLFGSKRNVKKAAKAATELAKLNPVAEHLKNKEYLDGLADLDSACSNVHKLVKYFADNDQQRSIIRLMDNLPPSISEQPFAYKIRNKFSKPRKWLDKEICYFANFGGEHFEKWSPHSLKAGIGGSETAIIKLAQEWTRMGYKVTVYGDPGKDVGVHDGVTYLPYFAFNKKDKFNIFIQWRNVNLAGLISAKNFLVDLHDVYHEADLLGRLESIDRIMVKSKYQRGLAPNIPNSKFMIISNGIDL